MSRFLYVPPYRMWSLFGTVTAGTIDTPSHEAAWAVDGRPLFPIRLTGANGSFSIANASGPAGIVAICHHLLAAGSVVTLSGDLSGTLTAPALPRNGIPLNFAALIGEDVNVDSVGLAISGNTTPDLIGEVVIGAPLELDPPLRLEGSRFRERQFFNARGSELSGIPPYSEKAKTLPLAGSQFYSNTMKKLISEWFDGQDLAASAYPIPSLIVPDDDNLEDVRLMYLADLSYTRVGPIGSELEWLIEFDFLEVVRTRW